MGLGERIIQLNCLLRGCNGPFVGFVLRHRCVFAQQVIGVGQSDIGLRVAGIMHDGLRKVVQRAVQAFGCSLVPLETSSEVKLVGELYLGIGNTG
jgi:hypothetical protein